MTEPETIEIRIRRDGTLYFSQLPEELLEVAARLNDRDPSIARRLELLRAFREQRQAAPSPNNKEAVHVAGSPDA